MAALENTISGDRYYVPALCIIGRAPHCDVRLSSGLASGVHAQLRWNGTAWELRDLSSRNGTYVDGRCIDGNERVELVQGMTLAFGNPDEPYRVESTAPPVARARADDEARTAREADHDLLLLPGDDEPELTIFEDPPGRWWAEDRDGNRHALETGQTLRCGGRSWTLELPLRTETTQRPRPAHIPLDGMLLRLTVSRDEEHVEVTVVYRDQAIALPARKHNELLLLLARARQKDREEHGLPESEAGWRDIDEVCEGLKIDANLLNQHKTRARKQLAQAKVTGGARIFESRPLAHQIRLGVGRIEIVKR
jgi:pSer/pThr/pTyr-binding forkhead associated (FHA) protein